MKLLLRVSFCDISLLTSGGTLSDAGQQKSCGSAYLHKALTNDTMAETHLEPKWSCMCSSRSSLMQCFKSHPIIWPSLHSSYTRHARIYHAFCYGFCDLDSMAQEVSSSFVSSKIIQNQRVFSWDGNWILTSHLMLLCITPPTTFSRYILTS